MTRTLGVHLLTITLGCVQLLPKEASRPERSWRLNVLEQLAHASVSIRISVLNGDTGAFVPNLKAEDFVIEENGERHEE